uniref:PPM-type phosphatase domain-containing protein n=1 Tax=Hemiselmis andersenii TaxID=464988 RepID=A0A7S0TR29_HEMAN|mmetsp:Transcript_19134/g.44000  ORF Transcript_19134/g.44000 Transcript_19134/m.44000 type:complete len:397 (+) Transcript_19134:73-1263(+)
MDDLDDLLKEVEGLESPQKGPMPSSQPSKPVAQPPQPVAQPPAAVPSSLAGANQSKTLEGSKDFEAEIDGLLDGLDDTPTPSPAAHKAASAAASQPLPQGGGFSDSLCTGVWLGSAEEQGNRPSMEDRFIAKERFFPPNISGKLGSTRALCGVFDGHSSAMVAQFASTRLPEMMERESWYKDPKRSESDSIKKSLEETFVRLDEEILAMTAQGDLGGGATANVALLLDGWLHVANLGDARAVLSRGGRAMPLSVDHKPDAEAERMRIENANGKVEWRGCWRVMTSNGGNPRGLAVSRAFGDMDWKVPHALVESTPDVMSVELNGRDEFVIVGCDGVWDVLQNQDAVDIARRHLSGMRKESGGDVAAAAAAQQIASHALGLGSMDNVTVVVMAFLWA